MESHIVTGRRSTSRGFTLIELLVVMVIIASLLTIAAPRYFRSVDRTKEVVLAQDLAVMREAIDKFYGDRGQYPESLAALADERYILKVPVDPITKSADSWVTTDSTDPDLSGIVDVHSGADRPSSSGEPYSAW